MHAHRLSAGAVALPTENSTACRNCGVAFHQGADVVSHYCPNCGQETALQPPSVIEFARQFGGNYIAPQGALLQTLKALMFQPGFLVEEWKAGRRRRYILPLRLYLTLSVLFFFVLKITASLHPSSDLIEVSPQDFERVLGWLQHSVWPVADALRQSLLGHVNDAQARYHQMGAMLYGKTVLRTALETFYYALLIMLPLQALALKFTYRALGWNYGEHLLFVLNYTSALLVFMLMVLLMPWAWLGLAVVSVAILHAEVSFRRIYGGIAKVGWRRLVLSLLNMLYTVPMMVSVLLYAFFN